ncbi:MAG TPA: hypothetical protein VKV41_12255 [Methylomirabilota bacterium]|nr:hypothetical protein [Methylomirabilota bacterium]
MRQIAFGWWILILVAAWPQTASAQVFLAANANPSFEIGPLLVTASITEAVASRTPVRIVWGIVSPAGGPGLDGDLYLLWPGRISGADTGPPEPGLVAAVERPGTRITASGHLALSTRTTAALGSGFTPEPVAGGAPFVSFERQSNLTGRLSAGSLIRIPWSAKLGDRDRLMVLELQADRLVRPHQASWLRELFLGRRYDVALSFNNVRVSPLFALYLRQRDHVVHLADEVSQLTLSFQQARSLQLDEIAPPSAMRQPSDGARAPETVSLVLNHSDGLAPQILQVRFGYFSGLWAVLPLVFTVGLVGLGHVAGPLVAALARRVQLLVATHLHVGGKGGSVARTTGVILSRDTLDRIVPGATTYDEALKLCGPLGEEHQSLTGGNRRRLVYRGRRVVPHPQRTFGWVATVSYWDIEDHEVMIEFDGDRVRDVQAELRRMRGAPSA